jgi:hypothetical protein
MGLADRVGVLDLPNPEVLLHGHPQGVHLLVQLGDLDEQPHKIMPPGRC